ncbi:MAG: VOC family protein [Propionibacteriaceae bacterium]
MPLRTAIPALPVSDLPAATAFYRDRLGFAVTYADVDFAIVSRDECVLHLWVAGDAGWRDRADFAQRPVRSGAEDFIAGTASCRIEVSGDGALDALFEELKAAGVLHYSSSQVVATDYGTREFHVSDLANNLLSFYVRT